MAGSSDKTEVTLFFRKPRPQYFSIEKVFEQVIANLPENVEPTVYKLKNGTTGWWGRVMALFDVYRNRGEINHITGDITFLGLILPKKGLIITYHDLESLAQYKGVAFYIIKYLWVIIPVKRAEVITVISEHTKQKIIEWTAVAENRVVVIPNPLPEEIVYSPKKLNAVKPVILVMGTKENKNVERIMRAVQQIDCILLIVGKMSEEQKKLADRLNLKIENLIQVPYSDIVKAYRKCDLLCFPSLYEGFGMPIIEAQATGRPVITSNYGAMREVAGEGALLVDPNSTEDIHDAVKLLISDNRIKERLVKNGLENVEEYRANKVGERYGEVYDNL